MAKITRKHQKQFGSTAPSSDIGKFGSLAAGSPLTSTDPDVIQALSNYLDGWKAAVVGSNSPAIEDMNALCFLFARQLAYIFQAGVAEWNTSTVYYIGSLASDGLGVLYVSLTDTNTGNALTDSTKWKLYGSNVLAKTFSDSGYSAVRGDVLLWSVSGGDSTFALPTASANLGATITAKKKNSDTSANVITATTSDLVNGVSTFVITEPGESATFICDGSGWWTI